MNPLLRSAIALACGLVASSATAQPTDASPSRSLEPVSVTASRIPTQVADTVAETTVIGRDEIDRVAGRTLTELLGRLPGLQWSGNGGAGKPSGLFIRGLEPRHTLLLVDGVRLGSATVGTPSFDNLPLAAIERIEVVRGPLSSVYGSEAAGGVVQVFTRRGHDRAGGDLHARVGSHRYRELSGGLGFGSGPLDGAVSLGHSRTRGFSATHPRVPFGLHDPDDDGFEQTAGSVRLGWQATPDWRIDGLALESAGLTRYDDGPGVDSRARLRNGVQSLAASGRLADGWRTRLSYGRATDVYDTLATASAFTPLGATRTEQRQLGWETTVATPVGVALALLERIDQQVSRPGEPFATGSRSIDAAAIGLVGEGAGQAWQAALRHDRNSQFGAQTTGSVGYGRDLAAAWRAFASYGTSFVAPSFNQLYFPGFGNPTLQPESGRHGELGLRYASGAHALRAAYVDNRIRGYIPAGPLPANVPRTRIDGWVLAYEGRLGDARIAASYERLDPRNATDDSPDAGRLLPRRAREALRAGVDAPLGRALVGATLLAFSERYEDPANQLRMAGFATLDLRAAWAIDRAWSIGLALNNVADVAYETAYGYTQPGREVYLTLRWAQR
jgi:vitamin B12 transporter